MENKITMSITILNTSLLQIYEMLLWFEEIPHTPILENIAILKGQINVEHINNRYKLPGIVQPFQSGLIEFRKHVHNLQYGDPLTMLRDGSTTRLIDLDYDHDSEELSLITQEATYYDNVVTNFSVDTWIGSWNSTVREKFEPGPFIKPLNESVMGNQIGTGAMILTADNYLLIQHRSAKTMINAYGIARSLGGSAKYIQSHFIDGKPHPFQTLIGQAHEEFSISETWFDKLYLSGVTRDIEWGGKPYFFFTARLNRTFADFMDNLKKKPAIDAWEYDRVDSILLGDDLQENIEMLREFSLKNMHDMPSPTRTAFYFLEQTLKNEVDL